MDKSSFYQALCIHTYVQTRVGQYTDILGIPQYHFDTNYNFINTEISYLGII